MGSARGQAAVGLAGALGLHGALLGILFFVDPPRPQIEPRRAPVQIKLVKRDPPPVDKPQPPEPKVDPEPPKPKPAEPKPVEKAKVRKPPERKKPKVNKPPKIAKAEPPKPTPTPPPIVEPEPAPAQAAPETPKPRKARKFTVAMEATVPGGGVAVPTAPAGSAWAYGSPDGAEDAPKALGGSPDGTLDGTGDGPVAPVEAAEVTVLPKLLSAPSTDEMRELYPARARRDGLEANVALKILVSSRGEVVRVRILKPAGNGFDEVAERLVRQFKFEPGTRSGRSVPVWMPWTYKFRLDG